MEDAEPVSSTTPSLDDPMEQWSLSKPQYEPIPDEATPEDEDDMIDLVGGGKEALDRHRINDNPTTDRFAMGEPHHPALVETGEQLVTRGLWGDAPVTETKTEEPTEKPRVEPVSPVKETPAAAPPPTYEPHFSSASSQPLAHSSAEGRAQPLGQESNSSGFGSVPLASSLSPLHSPDSLEELSLSESPNQAPLMSVPFGSGPVPSAEFSQKLNQDVPLSGDVKMFECKSEMKESFSNDSFGINRQSNVGVSFPSVGGDQFLSSLMTSEMDLGPKVDEGRSMRCEDSGVPSSPDEKLGSSVGSHEDAKTDSDKEGFDKDSESGESAGSTPTQSPFKTKTTTETFLSHDPFNPTANVDASRFDSHEVKMVEDPFKDYTTKASWYEPDVLTSKADDDFIHEMRAPTASKNPFQGFSPIGDPSVGFSSFGETASDRASKMSESPTPDLVQDAHDGDLQDSTQTKLKEEVAIDLVKLAPDSVLEPSDTTLLSASPQKSEETPAPPSLPDILKSSPLNPEKLDSGSSEESSDVEQSPRRNVVCATQASTNPFAFDAKISLLKEMVEETEARTVDVAKVSLEPEKSPEKIFGAFDLVKEVEITSKGKDLKGVEEDWMFSGQDFTKSLTRPTTQDFPVSLPSTLPEKRATREESDSESPITDSLSPVLEAMAKHPASFQVEPDSKVLRELEVSPVKATNILPESGMYAEEQEVSEQEVSSEEFEFIERPPKGVMDEFLETLESSKFAKASEMATDDEDVAPKLRHDIEEEPSSQQSSYMLFTHPMQKSKAELESPAKSTNIKEASPVTKVSAGHSSTEEPQPVPAPQKGKVEEHLHPVEETKVSRLSKLSTETGNFGMDVHP